MIPWLLCLVSASLSGTALAQNSNSYSTVFNDDPYQSALPQIGDTRSAIISLDEEYRLGHTWLRVLRASAPQLNDPQVHNYVEDLIYRLAANSNLQDQRLTLVMLKNPSLNAFAVPGGVIGIHGGLLRHARTEGQFASVLAHEISHLSQRHYAGQLDQQRKNLPLQLASMLGGIILAASSGGEGAVAAMASSQAAFHDRRLSYSRQNEREADNIGMEVLTRTGFDPQSMPEMFESMQRSSRFSGSRLPEFLLTHPVTQSRIAESMGRARQLPSSGRNDSLEYQLMRARTLILMAKNPDQVYDNYQQELQLPQADEDNKQATTEIKLYAAAFAALQSKQPEKAAAPINTLLAQNADHRYYRQLQFEYWIASGEAARAETEIRALLELYPDNHPLTLLLIDSLQKQRKYTQMVQRLETHLELHPDNSQLWYELAEARGLINDISGVHQARAEYFLLTGAVKKAQEHLDLALRNPQTNEQEKAKIKTRMADADTIREQLEEL